MTKKYLLLSTQLILNNQQSTYLFFVTRDCKSKPQVSKLHWEEKKMMIINHIVEE